MIKICNNKGIWFSAVNLGDRIILRIDGTKKFMIYGKELANKWERTSRYRGCSRCNFPCNIVKMINKYGNVSSYKPSTLSCRIYELQLDTRSSEWHYRKLTDIGRIGLLLISKFRKS